MGAGQQEVGSPFRNAIMGVGWEADHRRVTDDDVTIVHQLYRHAGGEPH